MSHAYRAILQFTLLRRRLDAYYIGPRDGFIHDRLIHYNNI